MPKINVLDRQTAELIAAGEVVERPASAIKELVENSIDAGATAITVEIEGGGVVLMRITDNGCGIARDDVPRAFLRHATSKISTERDLDSIGTLGFRGEALAAISAVSRVTMITRRPEDEEGTHYAIHGGEEQFCDGIGCAAGTIIEVRDLFYNTPARMKFLKKDVKEGANVAAIIDRMALSHPEISFKFVRDGKQQLVTQGNGKLYDAVYSVLGRDIALGTLPIEYSHGGIRVSGLICKPFKCRPNRNLQLVFLNGRFVKSTTAMAALDVGYKNSAMVGKFPYCVLNIEMPHEMVDVNVHPAKTEVRFSDESRVFDAIRFGVRSALASDESRPQLNVTAEKKQIRMTADEFMREIEGDKHKISSKTTGENLHLPVDRKPVPTASTPKREGFVFHDSTSHFGGIKVPRGINIDVAVEEDLPKPAPKKEVAAEESKIPQPSVSQSEPAKTESKPEPLPQDGEAYEVKPFLAARFIGEAFKTYIIAELEGKLILIDKHAAHERIIYERLKKDAKAESQLLLSSRNITLPKEEYAVILENLETLTDAGFDIEDFGMGAVVVRAVPSALGDEDIYSLLCEIAENLATKNSVETERLDDIYHTVACKAATKAGYVSSEPQLIELMNQVMNNPDIRYCPHGRPVAVEMDKKAIEKLFGRLG